MFNLRASLQSVKFWFPLEIGRNSYLLMQLIRRDFRARFMGSALGVAWAVLQPLSLVILYWFVFTVMIPRGPGSSQPNYALFLISGLLPWLGISEGLARATTSIVENAAMVRRLPFRSEILVVVPNASAILFQSIAIALFLLFLLARGAPLRGLWLLPLAMLLQFLLQVGIGWLLAVTCVFVRDVTQVLGFVLSFAFYLSPILYDVAGRYEAFFAWNPMTPLLGLFRAALLDAPLPQAGSIVFLMFVTTVAFAGGLLFFRRAQPGLADLI
ncbi:MAG TPA: ABC transporter permease [Thermoanaerobaculia bacterium]|nr:ABC transporter permease [Thermoanaerobaculia bacterium]